MHRGQDAIAGCGFLLTSNPVNPVEVTGRVVFTDDAYQAIAVKSLTSGMFTGLWYNPNNSTGSISLWPVPNGSIPGSLVLYVDQPMPLFVSLTASYDLPGGYDEAFVTNLGARLAMVAGREVPAELASLAKADLRRIKTANFKMSHLAADPMFVQSTRRAIYNINTGQGG